uniref:SH2 domain-containing protein n=1 Tax=Ciona savignyi TaxID=51511 RepID=H2ZGU1_CIOSA
MRKTAVTFYYAVDSDFWDEIPAAADQVAASDLTEHKSAVAADSPDTLKLLGDISTLLCNKFNLETKSKEVKVIRELLAAQTADNDATLISKQQFMMLTAWFGSTETRKGSCHLVQQIKNMIKNSLLPIESANHSWFAGPLTLDRSDEVLRNKEEGTFLIRFSEGYNKEGGFVLAIKGNNSVTQYRICGDPTTASDGDIYDAKLKFYADDGTFANEITYPDIVQFVNGRILNHDFNGVKAQYVCPNLNFNALFSG